MSSQRKEKNPPISYLRFTIFWLISAVICAYLLGFLIADFALKMVVVLTIFLPIYVAFRFKYYQWPSMRWGLPHREGSQCPHHPAGNIVAHCSTCHIPICAQCQDFKVEMREAYQHNFRLNQKLFDQPVCMDCIFKQLEMGNRILIILSPMTCIIGVGIALAGLYVDFFPTDLFLILGIIFFILGGVLFILTYIFSKERSKLSSAFQGKS